MGQRSAWSDSLETNMYIGSFCLILQRLKELGGRKRLMLKTDIEYCWCLCKMKAVGGNPINPNLMLNPGSEHFFGQVTVIVVKFVGNNRSV